MTPRAFSLVPILRRSNLIFVQERKRLMTQASVVYQVIEYTAERRGKAMQSGSRLEILYGDRMNSLLLKT